MSDFTFDGLYDVYRILPARLYLDIGAGRGARSEDPRRAYPHPHRPPWASTRRSPRAGPQSRI
jgi:hypothetical protein